MIARMLVLSAPLWLALTLLLQVGLTRDFTRATWGAEGDGEHHLWVLAWVYHALTSAPRSLFDANIFYPARDALALADYRIADQLFFGPAFVLTGSPIVGVNVTLVAHFVLTALATALLAHRLVGSWRPALLAAAMFAFSPARMAQLDRPHLLGAYWTPLALYFLDRFATSRRWADLWAFSLCVVGQFLTSYYLGYFLLLAVVVWIVGYGAPRLATILDPAFAGRLVTGGGLAAALVAGASLPYLRVRAEYAALEVSREFLQRTSAEGFISYLAAHPASLLYGRLLRPPQSGLIWEKWCFPGLLATALAVLALFVAARRGGDLRRRVWTLWGLVAAAFLLSLGPEIRLGGLAVPSPYLFLWHAVPGFASLRVPARLGLLVAFGLSLAAAFGYRVIEGRFARPASRAAMFGLTFSLVLLESASAGRAPALPTEIPEEYRWVAVHGAGAVLELPMSRRADLTQDIPRATRYMYFSLAHWRPLVNGFSGYTPAPARDVQERLAALPARESLRYLQAIGVRTLILHHDAALRARLLAAVRSLRGAESREFPSGSVVVTLPEAGRQDDVGLRLAAAGRIPSGEPVELGLLFANTGARYWMHASQRACGVTVAWSGPDGEALRLESVRVLPPVGLAPGEARERAVRVRAPTRVGSARLTATVTCADGRPGGARWVDGTPVTLVTAAPPAEGPDEPDGWEARYLGQYVAAEICADCLLLVRLHAVNAGPRPWKRHGVLGLAYVWTDLRGTTSFAGRLPLDRDVRPGQEIILGAHIRTPRTPGTYRLAAGLALERGHWIGTPATTEVSVESDGALAATLEPSPS